jgi:DtxR family Mn-dependent transcriptional regulator
MVSQREDPYSRSVQDYLKVIYSHTRENNSVSTVGLAVALDVKPASVTNMLQKMDEFQPRLVNYQKHRGVSLTANGEKEALRIIRRHRLIEQFLFEVLGYSWDKVHSEAEELEHVISPYFEDRLAIFLGEPAFDPHGEPIPNRALEVELDESIIPLSQLTVGQVAVVRRVNAGPQELLAYLDEIDLRPGREVQVLERNPIDGTMRALIGSKERFFGSSITEAVFVSLA